MYKYLHWTPGSVVTRLPRCSHLGSLVTTEQFRDRAGIYIIFYHKIKKIIRKFLKTNVYFLLPNIGDVARRRTGSIPLLKVPTHCCVVHFCRHYVQKLGSESCMLSATVTLGLTQYTPFSGWQKKGKIHFHLILFKIWKSLFAGTFCQIVHCLPEPFPTFVLIRILCNTSDISDIMMILWTHRWTWHILIFCKLDW